MSEQETTYLCETCKHRHGDLRTYHRIDSSGIERHYLNSVKVHCKASRKNPNTYRDAVESDPYRDVWSLCGDYRRSRL